MPAQAETVVLVGIGLLAVLLAVRILMAAPGRARRSRRPESRTIRVVGVGGGGGNAVDRMVGAKLRGVSYVACNTDAQALRRSSAGTKLRIGDSITGGLGSGGDPEIGRRAAEEDVGSDRSRHGRGGSRVRHGRPWRRDRLGSGADRGRQGEGTGCPDDRSRNEAVCVRGFTQEEDRRCSGRRARGQRRRPDRRPE